MAVAVRASALLLFLVMLLAGCAAAAQTPCKLTVQLPVGSGEDVVYVCPNSTVNGLVVVESTAKEVVEGCIEVECSNCTLLTSSLYNFTLKVKGDSRAYPIKVEVGVEPGEVKVVCRCSGAVEAVVKRLVPKASWDVDVDLIIPSDSYGNLDPRRERFTVVAKPSYVPAFLRFISGETREGHLDLLSLACVEVYGSGRFTVVLLFRSLDGSLLPISSSSTESLGGSSSSRLKQGVVVLTGVEGGSKAVLPLFTPVYPEALVGEHEVEVLVYPCGSSTPIVRKTYPLRIVSTRGEALLLTAFSALVALPVFVYVVVRYLGRGELKDVVLCSLLGCLTFAVVTLPGQVVWGLSSILGPFDWVVHGAVYDALLYMLYVVALALRPRVGTLTMVLFTKWIMYSLFFGRLSVISVFWQATTCLFFEPLLYLTGVARGRLSCPRLLASLVPASIVDKYVDLMLYAALYRLYYADWYVVLYSVGNALYTIPGIIAGLRLAPYVKGVIHE